MYLHNDGVERRDTAGEQQSGDGYCELNHGGGFYQATKCKGSLIASLGSSVGNGNLGVEKITDQKVFSRFDRRFESQVVEQYRLTIKEKKVSLKECQ